MTRRSVSVFVTLLFVGFSFAPSSVLADDQEKKSDATATVKSLEMKLKDLTLTVPVTWKESDIPSRMRLATLIVPSAEGDNEKGELSVFNFGGGGGGMKANIDRWKGQFSSEGRKAVVTKGKIGEKEYYLLEAAGTFNKSVGPPIMRKTEAVEGYRMLAAIIPVGSENYFLKLTGPDATVKAAAEDFRKSFGGSKKSEEKLDW